MPRHRYRDIPATPGPFHGGPMLFFDKTLSSPSWLDDNDDSCSTNAFSFDDEDILYHEDQVWLWLTVGLIGD